MARRSSLLDLADLASGSRRRRVLQEVLLVWQQYVQAMKLDVDPESPFASPRSAKQNRRLVKRMAVMMGSTEVGTEHILHASSLPDRCAASSSLSRRQHQGHAP